MKRPLIIAAVVVVLAAIIFVSVRASGSRAEKVYVEPAKVRKLESVVTAPGEINPKVKVNISAHIVGKIERLYFDEGDMVKRGQKLVDLERFTYEAQYQQAKAEAANRRIEVLRAKAALDTTNTAYRRAVSMRTQGIEAQELYDKASLDLENARAAYESAQGGVRQADAIVTQAATNLSHTTIVSPIDGKAVQLNAHEGEVVVTGTMNNPASVIAVIADMSEILAEADVGETEVVGIRSGQQGKVKVDAVPDKDYAGHVSDIGSSAGVRQNAGLGLRYFKVKTAIDNADDRLRPGMTCEVSIVTTSVPHAVAVPIQSVVERVPPSKGKDTSDEDDENTPRKKYVFIVRNGKVKMTAVATGVSDATHVVITAGVKASDQVVTGPFRVLKKLKDGDAVEITREEKKAKENQ